MSAHEEFLSVVDPDAPCWPLAAAQSAKMASRPYPTCEQLGAACGCHSGLADVVAVPSFLRSISDCAWSRLRDGRWGTTEVSGISWLVSVDFGVADIAAAHYSGCAATSGYVHVDDAGRMSDKLRSVISMLIEEL